MECCSAFGRVYPTDSRVTLSSGSTPEESRGHGAPDLWLAPDLWFASGIWSQCDHLWFNLISQTLYRLAAYPKACVIIIVLNYIRNIAAVPELC